MGRGMVLLLQAGAMKAFSFLRAIGSSRAFFAFFRVGVLAVPLANPAPGSSYLTDVEAHSVGLVLPDAALCRNCNIPSTTRYRLAFSKPPKMEMNYDENTLHELEAELQTEILPGTEIMIDVGAYHFVKARDSSERVLVPQPSADPNDPLNWSSPWKIAAIGSVLVATFAQGFGPLALAPMFGDLIEAYDSTLADVIQFTGVCILVLGFSNLFWVPVASTLGRRFVIITSTLICLASSIWRARAQTYGSFMGACVVNGFGAGPAETLAPTVIADVFFLHDRGKMNTLYFVFYFGSLMIGPIVSGPMATHVGWRNFWWLNVGVLGFAILLLVFMFPESKWHRTHPSEITGRNSVIAEAPQSFDKASKLVHVETAQRDPFLEKGRPSKQQFKLWQALDQHAKIIQDLFTPWKLLTYPIVQFASFVVSWSASCFLTANLTQDQAFAAPPYLKSSQTIGFYNWAIFVGALIGLFTAGPLSDWISMHLTRKAGGIREPEMRLPAMVPYVLILIIGNVITAVGYQESWSWKIIVIIGYTCLGIQVAALPAIASTYAVDSYKPVAGSIFVSITINKNVWGYGFSKFITPWIIKDGYIDPIMTNMTLAVVWCLFGVLFWYKGKMFRRWSKNSKVHQM